MNVLQIGYGKMGKEIHEVLKTRRHKIVSIIEAHNTSDFELHITPNTDVAIEFSTPETAFVNVKKCLRKGIPVVTGTTGWNHKLEEAKQICIENNTAFLYASNFSVGMNLLFAMNKKLAQLMNPYNQYNVSIEETHHIQKKDKPSGTAVTIAEQIVAQLDRYSGSKLDDATQNEIPIKSIREGEIFGNHTVTYKSEIDEIFLGHKAANRKGFALGAVLAAEYIYNKKGIFTINEVINL